MPTLRGHAITNASILCRGREEAGDNPGASGTEADRIVAVLIYLFGGHRRGDNASSPRWRNGTIAVAWLPEFTGRLQRRMTLKPARRSRRPRLP